MYSYRLQVFHAVATTGSFSRAAWRSSTSAASRLQLHVHALEAELGDAPRRGQPHHPHRSRPACAALCRTSRGTRRRDAAGAARTPRRAAGHLRLGASSTPGIYLLPPVLATFVQRYPGITLELEIANSQRVVDGVLARQWDLGMIGIPLAHPQLHVQPYWRDTLVLIVAPHHCSATGLL